MPEETQPVVHDTSPSVVEEPPLKNRQSCFWRGCSLLLFFGALILIFFTLIATFVGGPSAKRLASLPPLFPSDVPLYRFPDRSAVNFLAAPEHTSSWQRLALLPRYILGPSILRVFPSLPAEKREYHGETIIGEQITWSGVQRILREPRLGRAENMVVISWDNLNDSVRKVSTYYQKNLQQQDYQISQLVKNPEEESFTFQKNDVRGEIKIIFQSKDKEQSISNISLKVYYPNEKEK